MDRLIHTPEGVRDVYNQECTKKLYLENQIEQVFHAFGYQDIETPTFEFFDVFGREVGTTPSRELYKFFDRDGNTLVLRPDFTPSIARAASMYFMEETMPIRLCYRGSSFREKYGLKYQLLHSWKAVFPELTGTLSDLSGKTFTAPLPSSVRRILQGEHLTGEGL